MLAMATFTIPDRVNYDTGLFIVFMLPEREDLCYHKGDAVNFPKNRTKSFRFEIGDELSKNRLALSVTITTVILVVVSLITVIGTCLYSTYVSRRCLDKTIRRLKEIQAEVDGALPTVSSVAAIELECTNGFRRSSRRRREQVEEVIDGPTSDEGDDEDPHDRQVPATFVHQLTTVDIDLKQQAFLKQMFRKSDLYVWLVLMMGIFYTIPAIQLVISHQQKVLQSGDQDLCYYNFLCAIPFGRVSDFNHIFSNIWYFGFGAIFIGLTWYRKRQHLLLLKHWKRETGLDDIPSGLPQHFGIYYALGYALIFEERQFSNGKQSMCTFLLLDCNLEKFHSLRLTLSKVYPLLDCVDKAVLPSHKVVHPQRVLPRLPYGRQLPV